MHYATFGYGHNVLSVSLSSVKRMYCGKKAELAAHAASFLCTLSLKTKLIRSGHRSKVVFLYFMAFSEMARELCLVITIIYGPFIRPKSTTMNDLDWSKRICNHQ